MAHRLKQSCKPIDGVLDDGQLTYFPHGKIRFPLQKAPGLGFSSLEILHAYDLWELHQQIDSPLASFELTRSNVVVPVLKYLTDQDYQHSPLPLRWNRKSNFKFAR